jgi:signal transduction histidine kinase
MTIRQGGSPCRRALLLILFLLLLPLCSWGAIPPEQQSRILVLNSYHPFYSWSDNEVSGIVEAIGKYRPGSEPVVEYLDCKFFPEMDHFTYLKDLLAFKLRTIRVPIIITVDNPALDFALKYRDELFPGVPIVFCGINGYEPSLIAGRRAITGVAELLDVRGTVELMLRIHPGTREIVLIHDYTTTGLATRNQAEKDLKGLERRVRLRFINNVSTGEMLREIRNLPPTALVLALSYSRDSEGRVFDHREIASLLGEQSPVPVYGVHEERLGYGIMGGSLLGGKAHGAKAAEMALEVLNGHNPDTMPVYIGKTTRIMFDYRLLHRFNVPLSSLPDGSVVINRPESFYRKYTTLVWSIVGVFAGLAVIIVLLSANIRQKQHSARELADKARELEKSNAELKSFNMLAYHDLQEPLRIIGGFVQLLQRRYTGRLDPEADEFMAIIVSNVSHLKQLFNDLLIYITLGQRSLKSGPVDGNELIAAALAEVQEAIDERRALITVDPFPTLFGNRKQLILLLKHLVENALKFSENQPTIHLACRRDQERDLISVQDNGIGIAPEYHETIFTIFKRLHGRDEYGGTGTGLAICKKIAELHGGSIWLESSPGSGSTFYVGLPAEKTARPLS